MVIFIMQGLGRRQAVSQVIAAGSAACSVEKKPMQAEDMTIPGAMVFEVLTQRNFEFS